MLTGTLDFNPSGIERTSLEGILQIHHWPSLECVQGVSVPAGEACRTDGPTAQYMDRSSLFQLIQEQADMKRDGQLE
ncbi:hypothetical protein F2P79_008641 [Pimephales promelas]|nr:hypothetical protein F2P79_008641 [Pimephales promelas]